MQCQAIKSDGNRCKAKALLSGDYCFRHEKTMKKRAMDASSEGGQAKKQYNHLGDPVRLKNPRDIQNFMEKAINSLWTGSMPAGNPAGALGYMAKIYLEAYEKGELEKRIEEIEKRLDYAEKYGHSN